MSWSRRRRKVLLELTFVAVAICLWTTVGASDAEAHENGGGRRFNILGRGGNNKKSNNQDKQNGAPHDDASTGTVVSSGADSELPFDDSAMMCDDILVKAVSSANEKATLRTSERDEALEREASLEKRVAELEQTLQETQTALEARVLELEENYQRSNETYKAVLAEKESAVQAIQVEADKQVAWAQASARDTAAAAKRDATMIVEQTESRAKAEVTKAKFDATEKERKVLLQMEALKNETAAEKKELQESAAAQLDKIKAEAHAQVQDVQNQMEQLRAETTNKVQQIEASKTEHINSVTEKTQQELKQAQEKADKLLSETHEKHRLDVDQLKNQHATEIQSHKDQISNAQKDGQAKLQAKDKEREGLLQQHKEQLSQYEQTISQKHAEAGTQLRDKDQAMKDLQTQHEKELRSLKEQHAAQLKTEQQQAKEKLTTKEKEFQDFQVKSGTVEVNLREDVGKLEKRAENMAKTITKLRKEIGDYHAEVRPYCNLTLIREDSQAFLKTTGTRVSESVKVTHRSSNKFYRASVQPRVKTVQRWYDKNCKEWVDHNVIPPYQQHVAPQLANAQKAAQSVYNSAALQVQKQSKSAHKWLTRQMKATCRGAEKLIKQEDLKGIPDFVKEALKYGQRNPADAVDRTLRFLGIGFVLFYFRALLRLAWFLIKLPFRVVWFFFWPRLLFRPKPSAELEDEDEEDDEDDEEEEEEEVVVKKEETKPKKEATKVETKKENGKKHDATAPKPDNGHHAAGTNKTNGSKKTTKRTTK